MTSSDKTGNVILKTLELAINSEIAAAIFYSKVADKIDHPEWRELALNLSETEKKHETLLLEMYKKISNGEVPAPFPGDPDEKEGPGPDWNTEPEKILQFAIKKEERNMVFYENAAKKAVIPELDELFLKLADEEREHFYLMQNQYQSWLGGDAWTTVEDDL
jgi:rubrerythrin